MDDQIIVINKPIGMSSTGALNIFKRQNSGKKAGHAGTLDPLADGVLVVATGKMTKQISVIQKGEKEYLAEFVFGASTRSLDTEYYPHIFDNEVAAKVSEVKLNSIISSYIGEVEQRPPKFSAIKINGERAYELVRKGVEFDTPIKTVSIHGIELLEVSEDTVNNLRCNSSKLSMRNKFIEEYEAEDKELWAENKEQEIIKAKFKITCGSGVYIRSIVRDMAEQLGTVGYMTELTRTRVGEYTLENAIEIQLD